METLNQPISTNRKKISILLVEDNESLGEFLCDYLQIKGFSCFWAKDGEQAMDEFYTAKYNFCILDIMLPKKDGFSIAHDIRKQSEKIPILFLTAKNQEEDRIKGFNLGADDYMTKPFSMEELIMRINAIIRRLDEHSDLINEKITLGKIKFGKISDDIIKYLEQGGVLSGEQSVVTAGDGDKYLQIKNLYAVNIQSEKVNTYVENTTKTYLNKGKKLGLVGGDHSCPFGYVKTLGAKYPNFGILHIDAHADLRKSYEGFIYSHASIMYNIITQIPQVSRIVQVGLRDLSPDEYLLGQTNEKIVQFFDRTISERLFNGDYLDKICDNIIEKLPQNVYISFDIDGLSPDNCPNTGTPVPGGLTYNQAVYLLKKLRLSGKNIIGFDLCEIAPSPNTYDEWDANVGARILYQLCLCL